MCSNLRQLSGEASRHFQANSTGPRFTPHCSCAHCICDSAAASFSRSPNLSLSRFCACARRYFAGYLRVALLPHGANTHLRNIIQVDFMKNPLVPLTLVLGLNAPLASWAQQDAADPSQEQVPVKSLGMVTVFGSRPSSLPTQIPTTIEGVSRKEIEQTINWSALRSKVATFLLNSTNIQALSPSSEIACTCWTKKH